MPPAPDPRDEQLALLRQRLVDEGAAYAAKARTFAELARVYGGDINDLILEVAGTARMGQARTATAITRAERLVEHLPRVLTLLERGELFVPTVELLHTLVKNCSEKVLDRLGQVLPERLVGLDAVNARELITRTLLEVEAEL